ncbi:hypothetical protein FRC09_002649 [Ceratobasidium sp. 395]|nr:hypothetical protein FRC09_002649 [Ceratobasidium sp. 395]
MAPRTDTVFKARAHSGGPVNNPHVSQACWCFQTLILMFEIACAIVAVDQVPTQREPQQERSRRILVGVVAAGPVRVPAPVIAGPVVVAPAVARPYRLARIARYLLFLIAVTLLSFWTSALRVLTWHILDRDDSQVTAVGEAAAIVDDILTENPDHHEQTPRRRPAAVVAADHPVQGQIQTPGVTRSCHLSFVGRWLLFLVVMTLSIINVLTWQVLDGHSPQATTVRGVATIAGNVLGANPNQCEVSRLLETLYGTFAAPLERPATGTLDPFWIFLDLLDLFSKIDF